MKKVIVYATMFFLSLILASYSALSQSSNEIQFVVVESPMNTNNDLLTISSLINSSQTFSGDGINVTVIVKNNSGKAIAIRNIADLLSISLYNDRGLNIAIPNKALGEFKKAPKNKKWRFSSESAIVDKVYINGVEDRNDIKEQEYVRIPAGGNYKLGLVIKKVKKIKKAYAVYTIV